MIYIVVSLFNILRNRQRRSIQKVLFFLLLFSSLSAYMVGRQPLLNIDVTIYVVYTVILLSILFNSFSGYSDIQGISSFEIREDRLRLFEKFVAILGLIIIVINIYILYNFIVDCGQYYCSRA